MKIGVTGTREGSNNFQLEAVIEFMKTIPLPVELHHGDCSGVDIEVATIARELGWRIVCHPPLKTESQGYFGGDEMREPAGYLQRDRAIVDSVDFMIVVPLQNSWQKSGGTWYTHDYAVKKNKKFKVFWPGEKNDD